MSSVSGDPAVPAGPGDAVVVAIDTVLREQLTAAGWQVRSVPAPAGDLTGLGVGTAAHSVDLVAIDTVLSPMNHPDKRAALATATRWLRPDGQLLLREPVVGVDRAGAVAGLLRVVRRLSSVSAEASHGPPTVDFYLTALRHVGFEVVDVLERRGDVVVVCACGFGRRPGGS